MWRSCGWRVVKDLVHHGRPRSQNPCGVLGLRRFGNEEQCGILDSGWNFQRAGFAAAGGGGDGEGEKMSKGVGGGGLPISFGEAKRLMRLVNLEALKTKLGTEGKEAIPYNDLLEACQSIGVARSKEEAAAFARVLDEAGVILLFRDKVLLHPDRVVDLVRKAVPLALTPDNDPVWEELKKMQEKKIEIDILAHKHVRRVLWGGLGLITSQLALFFRIGTSHGMSWSHLRISPQRLALA